ncbi:MAG: Zn-dependent exopeptidase M28, partial [Jiangellaceae bacterium]
MSRRILTVAVPAAVVALVACSGDEPEAAPSSPSPSSATPTPTPTSTPIPTPTPTPVLFDPAAAYETVEYLATRIGPREAASPAFQEAAAYVQARFEALGYSVSTAAVPVPAGDSWGVPVDAGTSANVIASPP